VIKDDYVTAQNISAILASDGAVVETASLGEERWSLPRYIIYDLIIVDLSPPDMPGLTVLNTLRSNSFHTEVDGNQGHQSETHTRLRPKCKSPTAFAAGRVTVWQERLGPDFWPDGP
jgi:CheY-like chemotaxis protein